MALIKQNDTPSCKTSYVKIKHDVYQYSSEPVFGGIPADPLDINDNGPGSGTSVAPISYNNTCYINDAPYTIDYSGRTLRNKKYGAFGGSNGWYQNLYGKFTAFVGNDADCYGSGTSIDSESNLSEEELENLTDISHWNFGSPSSILITPKHIVGTFHFYAADTQTSPSGVSNVRSFTFLLKNNTKVTVWASRVYSTSAGDFILWRIIQVGSTTRTDLSEEINNNLLTCYNYYISGTDGELEEIFNNQSKENTPIGFTIDGGDRAIRGLARYNSLARYTINPYYDATYNLTINDLDTYQPELSSAVWVGDSGSSMFVFDKASNKTICLGLANGGLDNYLRSPYYAEGVLPNLISDGYLLTQIPASSLNLMTLSDWSGLYVNNSGSSLNLPEYLGKIVVKNEVGTQQFVKTLYKNDGDGSASIIWDTTTPVVPEPTDFPTDIPPQPTDFPTEIVAPTGACCLDPSPDGVTCIQTTAAECAAQNGTYKGDDTFCTNETCTICGNCNAGDDVLYPTVGSNSVTPPNELLVNCSVWTNCGNIYNLTQNNTLNQYLDDPDTPGQVYARIYDLPSDRSTHLPPPLAYVMTDMATYTVKDRIVVYFNNQIVRDADTLRQVSFEESSEEYLLPDTPYTNFNTDHLGATRYNLFCDLTGGAGGAGSYTGTNFGFCTANPDILSDEILCACQERCGPESCIDIYGDVEPLPTGQDPSICIGVADLGSQNIILDTGCVATNINCPTVCYGTPIPPLQTDNSVDIKEYHCRSVAKLNPAVFTSFGRFENTPGSDSLITTNSALDGYNAGYKFGDIGIINDSGCDRDQCAGDPCPCSSAWKIRIFLPFYLNVPSLRYGPSGNPSDSITTNTDIRGKYVVFTKTDLNLGEVQQYPTAYNQHPLLKNLYDLIKGFIRSSGISISSPYDFLISSMRPDKMVWVSREIPRQINNNVCSHTHQVVLELTTASDRCSLCVNTAGISGATYDISAIRLYPITDIAGRLVTDSPLRLMTALSGHSGSTIGLRHLNSARYYYHPSADPSDSGAGYIYPSKFTSFTLQEELADNNNCVYIDTITETNFTSWGQYGNFTNTSFPTGDIFPWNLYELLNLWNQKALRLKIPTNCDCTVL